MYLLLLVKKCYILKSKIYRRYWAQTRYPISRFFTPENIALGFFGYTFFLYNSLFILFFQKMTESDNGSEEFPFDYRTTNDRFQEKLREAQETAINRQIERDIVCNKTHFDKA